MLKIALLGRPLITDETGPVTDFVSDKALLLFCYLVMHSPYESHARTSLAGHFWGEMEEKRARANLRMALYNLQKLFPGLLVADRKTISLHPEAMFWLDVQEFEHHIAKGSTAQAAAAALYRGEFLQGLAFDDAPELEDWLRLQRESLRLQMLEALEELIDHQISRGEWDDAIHNLRNQLAIEPWREMSHRLLMRLLARTRQFNAALAQYEKCREMLITELGVEPMQETIDLQTKIAAARKRSQPHQLPSQPTPLIGRATELGQLFSLLNDEERRLITLTGPGGSGKTRLAIAAAEVQAYAFLDGVHFVPFVGVTQPAGVDAALAGALHLPLDPSKPIRTQLLDYLRQKEVLLLFDNVEQIVDPIADLAVEILQNAPQVTLMITSRENLRLRWEMRLPLNGLPVPPPEAGEAAADYDAVRLFWQIAQAVQPAFDGDLEPVSGLCRLVEGMPLAIELAAAMMELETPQQLLNQVQKNLDQLATALRDVPNRHRSLRAVFDFSWSLLNDEEKRVFARLALFRGGFSKEAAAVVADASSNRLADLAAKSLLRNQAENRYELHEIVRGYAMERLLQNGEIETTTRRHTEYYLQQLHHNERRLHGSQQYDLAERLRIDLDNIQTAWKTAIAEGQEPLVAAAVGGLSRVHRVLGLFQAGEAALAAARDAFKLVSNGIFSLHHADFLVERHDYQAALEAIEEAWNQGLPYPELQAIARLTAARAHYRTGALNLAREVLDEGLSLAKQAGRYDLQATGWSTLGSIEEMSGRYDAAEAALLNGLECIQKNEDLYGLTLIQLGLGIVHFRRQNFSAGKKLLLEALDTRRTVDPTGLSSARILVGLGTVSYNLGEREEARRYYLESLKVFQITGDRSGEGLATDMLGRMAAFVGDVEVALRYYDQSLAAREAIGNPKGIADTKRHLADLLVNLGEYERPRELLDQAKEIYLDLGEQRSYGSTLATLALVNHYQGFQEEALAIAEEAENVANALENSLLLAYGLVSKGYALGALKRLEDAAEAFQKGLSAWRKMGQSDMNYQCESALGKLLWKLGRREEALAKVENVLARLRDPTPLDCDAPGRVYLDCVLVLQQAGDGRAELVREQAGVFLRQQADKITNEAYRRQYLENVEAHQILLN